MCQWVTSAVISTVHTVMYCRHTQTVEIGEEKQVTCADTTNIIKQFVNGFAGQSLQFV